MCAGIAWFWAYNYSYSLEKVPIIPAPYGGSWWRYWFQQGWEFAHRFFERIARFLPKNEQMSYLLKKMSDSLIRSFLVSDLSDSLTIAHFLWAPWANRSRTLIWFKRNERWANERIPSPGFQWAYRLQTSNWKYISGSISTRHNFYTNQLSLQWGHTLLFFIFKTAWLYWTSTHEIAVYTKKIRCSAVHILAL